MVLFDDVVQVLRLAHLDVRTRVGSNTLNGRPVGAALVDGYLFGRTVQADGLFEKASGSCVISLGALQKVDRIAVAVDRPAQILPLAGDLDVGLIHSPARANEAFAPSEYSG